MKCSADHLLTPLYLKLDEAMPWPDKEKAFYLLSGTGLFLCRNTPFFRSCVPVKDCPSELAAQQPFLKLNYPLIPRRLIETVVGFFDIVGERFASEAAVLLAWNRSKNEMEIVVPDQIGLVGSSWQGRPYPMELEYEVPALPSHLVLLGDIHSHVDGSAYASYMDKSDELHRPGLHIVVGRILDEPPQFHCEAVADGLRFRVRDLSLVFEGYHRRRVDQVPSEWLENVVVKPWSSKYHAQPVGGVITYSTVSPPSNDLEAGTLARDDTRVSRSNGGPTPGTASDNSAPPPLPPPSRNDPPTP